MSTLRSAEVNLIEGPPTVSPALLEEGGERTTKVPGGGRLPGTLLVDLPEDLPEALPSLSPEGELSSASSTPRVSALIVLA